MKPKKLSNKLFLNKRTVSNLNNREMKKLNGGVDTTLCDTNYPYVCDSNEVRCTIPCEPTTTYIPWCSVQMAC